MFPDKFVLVGLFFVPGFWLEMVLHQTPFPGAARQIASLVDNSQRSPRKARKLLGASQPIARPYGENPLLRARLDGPGQPNLLQPSPPDSPSNGLERVSSGKARLTWKILATFCFPLAASAYN